MEVSGDEIAQVVLDQFEKLPPKAKPLKRGHGTREWVPISGIVAQDGRNRLTCLALATGMKCLPREKVSKAKGIVLHDWHAEILVIRALNRFLLEECHALVSKDKPSEFVRVRDQNERNATPFQPFALHDEIVLHMYCSEAPCGDASMELTMAAQEDATPWVVSNMAEPRTDETWNPSSYLPYPAAQMLNIASSMSDTPILHGRGFFSALGTVRRKPSRPDAPPTLSKSCSDKLALKQCTSLLSSVSSMLIFPSNAYLSSLVLPESQHSETACTRAFSSNGRMKKLTKKQWNGGYRLKEFNIKKTKLEFSYSRRQPLDAVEKLVASNISAAWIKESTSTGTLETLIGGVLQGRKQFDVGGASRLCKNRMWKLAIEVALATCPILGKCILSSTYSEMKGRKCLDSRREVKEEVRSAALKGWIRNTGGEDFEIGGAETQDAF